MEKSDFHEIDTGNFRTSTTRVPRPMIEIEKVEMLSHAAGRKGGEEYLREIWTKVLFWTGSLSGYIIGIVSLIRDLK